MENPAPDAVKETDDMKNILAALELPEGSDEPTVVGAIEALKNSRSAAEDRALAVEKQLLTADVEADLGR